MIWPFRKPKYLAAVEYWVYVPIAKIPPQAAIMNRMLKLNPFEPGAPPPCGPAEGLFFSDIRLHMGLVLREKNVHVFRPDLFETHIVPTPEMLSVLAESQGFIKVRFLSEKPLQNDRHLKFVSYLTEATGAITRGNLIFDVVAERLLTLTDLRATLKSDPEGTGFDQHVHILWTTLEYGGRAETRGLRKKGLADLVSADSPIDHKVLVLELIETAAQQIWATGEEPEHMQIFAYDAQFELKFEPFEKNKRRVRAFRIPDQSNS